VALTNEYMSTKKTKERDSYHHNGEDNTYCKSCTEVERFFAHELRFIETGARLKEFPCRHRKGFMVYSLLFMVVRRRLAIPQFAS
jgi:hypothetical protein